jgi:hypothetical protein
MQSRRKVSSPVRAIFLYSFLAHVRGNNGGLDCSCGSDRRPHCLGMDKAIGIWCEGCGNGRFGIDCCHMWCRVLNIHSHNGDPSGKKCRQFI